MLPGVSSLSGIAANGTYHSFLPNLRQVFKPGLTLQKHGMCTSARINKTMENCYSANAKFICKFIKSFYFCCKITNKNCKITTFQRIFFHFFTLNSLPFTSVDYIIKSYRFYIKYLAYHALCSVFCFAIAKVNPEWQKLPGGLRWNKHYPKC